MKATAPHPPPLTLFLLLFLSVLCFGCTPGTGDSDILAPPPALQEDDDDEVSPAENVDSSCSYFYFLWATHAENNNRFSEAEEAYQKALICDPDSRYIQRRLPFLLIKMDKPYGAAQRLREIIKKFPDEPQDKLFLARLDIRNGETAEAIQLYQEVSREYPEDETIHLRLGFLYSQQNRYSDAEKAFHETIRIDPDSLFAHLYLARLAVQTGDIPQAEKMYQLALTINWSVELALEVADFYGANKEYSKVEQQYRAILQQTPDDEMATLGLVHTLLLQGRENTALLILKKMRATQENPNQVDIITARIYLRSGEFAKAGELLAPVALDEEETEARYILAVIRYREKKLDQANSLLTTIPPDATQFEDSIYLRVRILIEQKQDQQGIALLEEVLADKTRATPSLYTLLASLLMERAELQRAQAILDRAIAEYPSEPAIYFEYGLLMEQNDSQDEAVKQMEKVLQLDPDHAEALNYIGYTWADNNINLDQALRYIQKAMTLTPGNGYIQDSLAWVHFRLGNFPLALTEMKKALELEPADPNIYDHLGDIYRAQGESDKAREAYQKAEELFSGLEAKERMREKQNELP